jgi:SAM-dependent methyltransferase
VNPHRLWVRVCEVFELSDRTKFAGGDQRYLRMEQYRTPDKLAARANLHVKYRTASIPWHPWLAQQLAWPSGGAVLEVGCGPGWLWADVAGTVPADVRLTLSDLSPGMVEAALGRVRGLGRLQNAVGLIADVQALPFDDDAHDIVVANHMLYHAPNPATAVTELARVLHPAGTLVAATNGPRHLAELSELRSEVFDVPLSEPTVEAFGSESGRLCLEGCFEEVEWRAYDDRLHCTDVDDVMAFLVSAPPAEDASNEQLQRLLEAVRHRFADGGGAMDITKDVGVFLARGPKVAS